MNDIHLLKEFLNQFVSYVKKGDWCLDIGANIGDATSALRYLVGEKGKVICFEPNPVVFNILWRNCLKSGFTNCDLFCLGASDKYESKMFGHNGVNGGILEDFSEEERGNPAIIKVECVDIMHFLACRYDFNDVLNIEFIKMDIEGYESVVIRQLAPLLRDVKPVIFCEWWFHESKNDLLFDAIDYVNYQAFTLQGEPIYRTDFHTKKCQDLILKSK